MSEVNTKMVALIDELVESKTFSLDALDSVKRLRDTAIRLGEENTRLQNKTEAQQEMIIAQNSELTTLRGEAATVKAEREKQVQKDHANALVQKELDLTKSFKGELTGLMLAAFKSPVVRQDMFGNNTVMNNGFPQSAPISSTTTTVQD